MLILRGGSAGRFRSLVRCAKHIGAPLPLTRKFKAKSGHFPSSQWACVKQRHCCSAYGGDMAASIALPCCGVARIDMTAREVFRRCVGALLRALTKKL